MGFVSTLRKAERWSMSQLQGSKAFTEKDKEKKWFGIFLKNIGKKGRLEKSILLSPKVFSEKNWFLQA